MLPGLRLRNPREHVGSVLALAILKISRRLGITGARSLKDKNGTAHGAIYFGSERYIYQSSQTIHCSIGIK
jgi:hypothetical protein